MNFELNATSETITQPLYDIKDYATHIDFFAEPVGYKNKTFADTNMYFSSTLPRGHIFIMSGITIEFLSSKPGYRPDERKFHSHGIAEFKIGCKTYLTTTPASLSNGEKAPYLALRFSVADGKVSSVMTSQGDEAGCSLSPNDLILVADQYFKLSLYELPELRYPARVRAKLIGQLTREIA